MPQRVRATFAGETVVDTRRAKILFESNIGPRWYVPFEDVRTDLLTPTETSTHCPFKGDASYWTLTVGDRILTDVCWSYPEIVAGAPPLAGLVSFYVEKLEWFEEDEPVLGHPRDPYHRIDVLRSSDHVVVRAGGETVAETTRPVKLFETGLPPRWYVPEADVRTQLLVPSDTTTVCPYKGIASYRTVTTAGGEIPDAVWEYRSPRGEAAGIAGHASFLGDGVEVTVNGEPRT